VTRLPFIESLLSRFKIQVEGPTNIIAFAIAVFARAEKQEENFVGNK
jgi:hypothetical protein